jgi:hypothetical protein
MRHGLVIPVAAGVLAGLLIGIPLLSGLGPQHPRSLPRQVTARDASLLYQAEQILIRDCMRQHGFRYWPVPLSDQSPDSSRFPFVIDNLAWARRNGFGGGQSARGAAEDPNNIYFKRLPERRQAGYVADVDGPEGSRAAQVTMPEGYTLGHSSEGCQAQAEERLYGSYQDWFAAVNVTNGIRPLAATMVLNDPRYARAVRQWARCMRVSGSPYSSPAAAAAAWSKPARSRTRQAEIRAAVAEAECASSTGLAATARRLDTAYADVLSQKYRQEIQAYHRLRLDAVPIAQAIVAPRR